MKILTISFALLTLTFGLSFSAENNAITSHEKSKTTLLSETELTQTPPDQIKKAKEIIARVSAEAVKAVDAKTKYKMFCSPCHGKDGTLEVNGSKDLSKSTMSLEETVARIYFGEGFMNAFEGLMKEEEIVAVAEFLEVEFRGGE
ncbi:MAG: mono/diheme cytochrome c family protein [Polaribacter sp.]|jgi:mono/diheme cytochrome c family protein